MSITLCDIENSSGARCIWRGSRSGVGWLIMFSPRLNYVKWLVIMIAASVFLSSLPEATAVLGDVLGLEACVWRNDKLSWLFVILFRLLPRVFARRHPPCARKHRKLFMLAHCGVMDRTELELKLFLALGKKFKAEKELRCHNDIFERKAFHPQQFLLLIFCLNNSIICFVDKQFLFSRFTSCGRLRLTFHRTWLKRSDGKSFTYRLDWNRAHDFHQIEFTEIQLASTLPSMC